MIDNLSTEFLTFARRMLTSLSADEMLLPMDVNWFTNLRGLRLTVETAPFYLEHKLLWGHILPYPKDGLVQPKHILRA